MAESRVTAAGAYIEIEGRQLRLTAAGIYVELGGPAIRITAAGAYVEITRTQARLSAVGFYVELEYVAPRLNASVVDLLRIEAGRQDAFDSPAAMVVGLPAIGEATDAQEEHSAEYDAGLWTPVTIVDKVAEVAAFSLAGTLFFETLPLILEAGYGAMLPDGAGPYTYSGSAGPASPAEPIPYTFRFGGDSAASSAGSMIQIQDAYLQELHLEGSVESKAIRYRALYFGRYYDDNGALGYTPSGVPLPANLGLMQALRGTLAMGDAGDTGGEFGGVDPLACELIEWALDLDTGLRPAWAADNNSLRYCGVRHIEPMGRLIASIRTNLNTYAAILTRAMERTPTALEIALYGDDSRAATLQFTGRWLPKLQAHERVRGEVVLRPTFIIETPAAQTVTPHWASWEIVNRWEGLA
jgi:hypothetical protein